MRNQALDLLRKNKFQQLHDSSDATLNELADHGASQGQQVSLSQEQQAMQARLAQLKISTIVYS